MTARSDEDKSILQDRVTLITPSPTLYDTIHTVIAELSQHRRSPKGDAYETHLSHLKKAPLPSIEAQLAETTDYTVLPQSKPIDMSNEAWILAVKTNGNIRQIVSLTFFELTDENEDTDAITKFFPNAFTLLISNNLSHCQKNIIATDNPFYNADTISKQVPYVLPIDLDDDKTHALRTCFLETACKRYTEKCFGDTLLSPAILTACQSATTKTAREYSIDEAHNALYETALQASKNEDRIRRRLAQRITLQLNCFQTGDLTTRIKAVLTACYQMHGDLIALDRRPSALTLHDIKDLKRGAIPALPMSAAISPTTLKEAQTHQKFSQEQLAAKAAARRRRLERARAKVATSPIARDDMPTKSYCPRLCCRRPKKNAAVTPTDLSPVKEHASKA